MTRRHDALLPLTHDHHHALVQARALIEGSKGEVDERRTAAQGFLDFYEKDTLLHFHEEEEVLFPRLLAVVDEAPPELVRVLVEHVQIHGMVSGLREALVSGEPDAGAMKELGETLRKHVRLEENHLFPLIESAVAEAKLNEMRFAERDRT